ncbi:MAG: preprotein translocase subunit SecG [Chloroflexi bacterium]|nr:preprotein translocase subunit SecG [Chloroflexota bacterium]
MVATFNWIQIVLSILLTILILLQVKGIGSGFFGQAYSTFRTRRGLEQTMFRGTIFIAVVFVAVSMTSARIR